MADEDHTVVPRGSAPSHILIVQDFVAAIRESRDPLVDGVEGRRSLALVLAIYEAAGLGSAGGQGIENLASPNR